MGVLVLKRQRPRVGVKNTPPNPFTLRPRDVGVTRNRNAARRISFKRFAAQKKLDRERIDAEQRWEANKTTRTPEIDAASLARRGGGDVTERQPNNRRVRVPWTEKLKGPNSVNIQGGRPSLSGKGPRPDDVDNYNELKD